MEVRNLALWIVLFLVSSNGGNSEDNTQILANPINNFSLNFYKELAKTEDNMFCSGYSLSVALSMLLVGSGGKTASEIKTVLGYDSVYLSQDQIEDSLHALLTEQRENHTGYDFTIANSMWIHSDYKVLDNFKSTLKDKFYAEEKEVTFGTAEATDDINNWVKKETKNKITKLFDTTLDGLTRLVLVNAMYFKGTWQTKFNKDLTNDYPFHYDENGQSKEKDVKMMSTLQKLKYTESSELGSQMVELPYDGGEVTMVILLPFENNKLSKVENDLTVDELNIALNSLSESKVRLRMPKFEVSSSFSLEKILKALGVKDAFIAGKADLSGIDGTQELYVSKAVQKAVVEVSEEGTVAAAASGVVASIRTIPVDRPKEFIADRPFIFLIRHKPTGIVYFMGKYAKP